MTKCLKKIGFSDGMPEMFDVPNEPEMKPETLPEQNMRDKKLIHRLDYPADTDRMLVPLLDTLNSIPGCRTLYSCDGHGKDVFYVCLGICSEHILSEVRKVLRECVGDSEIDDGPGPDGVMPYETYTGFYSLSAGHLPYGKRKRFVGKLAAELEKLVPVNKW